MCRGCSGTLKLPSPRFCAFWLNRRVSSRPDHALCGMRTLPHFSYTAFSPFFVVPPHPLVPYLDIFLGSCFLGTGRLQPPQTTEPLHVTYSVQMLALFPKVSTCRFNRHKLGCIRIYQICSHDCRNHGPLTFFCLKLSLILAP